jgi:acyl dehydratase
MRVLDDLDELSRISGEDLGTSDWLEIDQDRVNRFADATGDHQWIHVDVERAAAGPFGGTIAHGYLTLSLVPYLGAQVFSLETPGAKLNYGVNKVRFPNPVPVGSRIRSHVTLGEVTDLPAGKQLTFRHIIEIEGQDKPACVAETVVLLLAPEAG